jgi:hypothetical protein
VPAISLLVPGGAWSSALQENEERSFGANLTWEEEEKNAMIEFLKQSRGPAFGFKIIGVLAAEDIDKLTRQIDIAVGNHKKPLGLLADLSEMHGSSWSGRWEEMRFLQRHSDQIARFAVISNDPWQEIAETIMVATAALQAETLYFQSSEILHAWHWIKMNKLDEAMPVRVMYPGKGLFQGYTPEYMGI